MNNDIDPLSTPLFVLTQTLIEIRQYHSTHQNNVQRSNTDNIHQKCFQNTIQQLPLCWLTVLHQVYVKSQNVNIILINFQQFLTTLNVKTRMCALDLFNMNVWKMMHEIMKICHQYLMVRNHFALTLLTMYFSQTDKRSPTTVTMYEECLMILANLANQLCCLPHTMITDLFDIKSLSLIQVRLLFFILILRSTETVW